MRAKQKKYGLENFSLGILEFCDKNSCISLEQKWIDLYKPNYNVLPLAGNSLGFKHTLETINKLKETLNKENHCFALKYGYISTPETKRAISEGIKNFYSINTHKYKGLKVNLHLSMV